MPSRRALLGATGRTLSVSALAMVTGSGIAGISSAHAADPSQDVDILNAAIALEYEGIAAYQIAATSGLLQPAVVEIGVTFQGHHKGHRDILVKAVETLGGTPVTEKPLEEYAAGLNVASLRNQEDVLRLALRLEQGAANAYLGLIPSLGVNFHQVAGQMAGDEAFHAAILANALGEPIPKAALIFG
ncbi:MAG: ferritin-like domain-containing protein [Alphaproteobacteria bacterium]|nr:MAG: ferritin-like domain-containing protein [Alphaproteobacteria bacterium]